MARFDLNLLSALDALLTERNVTRASERLNVTQPTMSGMLQRLRYQFDDQLLVKEGRQMKLTPLAASLVEHVREVLGGVEALIRAEPVFDPATSTREFKLMASDYCASVFLSRVVAYLARHAPSVRLVMQPVNAPVERMLSGEIDLCITTDDPSPLRCGDGGQKLHAERLFSDRFVCIVAEDHPIGEEADLSELLRFPHVGVHMAGGPNTIEMAALRKHAPLFKSTFVVSDFSLVPVMVANSNAVGVIQSRLADAAMRSFPIRSIRCPFAIPQTNETMLCHSRHIEEPAHIWMRSVLRNIASAWFGQDSARPTAMLPSASLGSMAVLQ